MNYHNLISILTSKLTTKSRFLILLNNILDQINIVINEKHWKIKNHVITKDKKLKGKRLSKKRHQVKKYLLQ